MKRLRREDGIAISDRAERNVVLLAEAPALTVTWSRYAPGEPGPGLHVHREHVDAFYILEGELTFALGPAGEELRVPAGGFVAAPPNVAHGFRNDGDAEARWLNFHAPDGGFGAYMRGARDGVRVEFDSFDVPPDGGLPVTDAIVTPPGEGRALRCLLPDLCLAEWTAGGPPAGLPPGLLYEIDADRSLTIHAPGGDVAEFLQR